MSVLRIVAVLAAISCFVPPTTAAGTTTTTYLGTDANVWMINGDQPVLSVPNVIGNTLARDKRDFDNERPRPGSFNVTVDRFECWHLDYGDARRFDWIEVLADLQTTHGIEIGKPVSCTLAGVVTAPDCYRTTVDVYVPHVREKYRVVQDGRVARISVMRPIDGMAPVYRDYHLLTFNQCLGSAAPPSTAGVCASVSNPPYILDVCPRSGSRKRNFDDVPVLSDAPEALPATWGRIKALYQSEE